MRPSAYSLFKVRIVGKQVLKKDVYLLSLKRMFDFTAGQVVALSIDETVPARLYSICSGENDETIDVLFDVHPEGVLTPRLADLDVGDEVLISEPFGDFRADEHPGWFIAAGTGIAPFHSMMRSGINGKVLIHGGRMPDSFYFEGYFTGLLGDDYIRCCSRCENNTFYKGRITSFLENYHPLPPANKYYLCGSAEMVVDIRDLLISKGVVYEQIISEIYF